MSFKKQSPWTWIPSLYIAEGIPNVIVVTVALCMFKRMGIDNTDSSFFIAWLYLPWVIKPFWSPVVDFFGTKRTWICVMQMIIGAALGGIAFMLPVSFSVAWVLALLWITAFSSATHDIAADGFYMLQLDTHSQALYVGVRSTFYRVATILGQGVLIMIAGCLETYYNIPAKAWGVTFGIAALMFLVLATYHCFCLPHPKTDRPAKHHATVMDTFVTFFKKPAILTALLFMLLYRFPEALLTPISKLFFLDSATAGGLGMTTAQVGFSQGTVGVIGLLLGGIIGGIAIARDGFGKWKWPMVAAISIPNAVYIYLAYLQPQNLWIINACVFVEQAGYGFGFTAYMMFLLYFAKGDSATSHYAFCTGFMALSMMVPGMFAGLLQTSWGYPTFFIVVMACTLLTAIVTALIKIDPMFGAKSDEI